MVYHASGGIFDLPKYFGHRPFGPIFDFGFAGVDFFFVLSGFIMMHVHTVDIGKPRALGGYLWKRFSRIYPAYWVVLAAIVPIFFLAPSFGLGHERDPAVIVRSVFLLPDPENRLVLTVAWTLVYEVFFYLLFGLLILNRRLGLTVLAVWTAGILAYPWSGGILSQFVFNNMNLRFLAGIGVALMLAHRQVPWPRMVACVGLVVFLGTGMMEAYDGPLSTWTQCVGYTLGSALMLAGVVQAERAGLIQPPCWLVYLGNASYSIYLVHFLGLSLLAKAAKATQLDLVIPGTILFWLHVIGAVGIACAFHHIVEHPIHAWAKRCFGHAKPTPVVLNAIGRMAA